MKKNLNNATRTELVFLLDRSGSMSGLEADTIGGFNALIERQKKEAGECFLTTVLFDDSIELLTDSTPLERVRPLTGREYFVRGNTALLDAVGLSIARTVEKQRTAPPHRKADRVLFVITTDGMENASRKYRLTDIRRMIEHEKTRYGWEFIFLGANIDAIGTAAGFGISADRAANYHADSAGTQLNFRVLSEAVAQVRSCDPLSADWKREIDEDYSSRS